MEMYSIKFVTLVQSGCYQDTPFPATTITYSVQYRLGKDRHAKKRSLINTVTKLTDTSPEIRVKGIAGRTEAPRDPVTDDTRMGAVGVAQNIPVGSHVAAWVCESQVGAVVAERVIAEAGDVVIAAPCIEDASCLSLPLLVYSSVSCDDAAFRFELEMSARCPASTHGAEVIGTATRDCIR